MIGALIRPACIVVGFAAGWVVVEEFGPGFRRVVRKAADKVGMGSAPHRKMQFNVFERPAKKLNRTQRAKRDARIRAGMARRNKQRHLRAVAA